MSSNLREFNLGVRDFAKKDVPKLFRDFRDAVALEGLKTIVLLTIWDTGRLRGNWQTTVGVPAEGELWDKYDKSGRAVISEGTAVIGGATDPFTPIWLHNGLSYADFINSGTATMPAVHMLEQTVARLKRIIASGQKGRAR